MPGLDYLRPKRDPKIKTKKESYDSSLITSSLETEMQNERCVRIMKVKRMMLTFYWQYKRGKACLPPAIEILNQTIAYKNLLLARIRKEEMKKY